MYCLSSLDDERYEAARASVVRRVLADTGADGVVVPTIAIRKAQYTERLLSWDGVFRKMKMDLQNTTYSDPTPRGTDFGTSLRIAIYARGGKKVFERYGGLEPITRIVVKSNQWGTEPRTDLFLDPVILDDGIQVAFDPWIVPPDED